MKFLEEDVVELEATGGQRRVKEVNLDGSAIAGTVGGMDSVPLREDLSEIQI